MCACLQTHAHTFSQLTHTCMDENVMGRVGVGGYVDMVWLGLAGMPYLYPLTPPPPSPPGSCGGSDKDGFPDQDQSDS